MSSAPPGSRDLTGRVAIVTGANHGIGAAIATRLASEGAAVVIAWLGADDPPQPGLPDRYRLTRAIHGDEVVSAIKGSGGRATAIEADLADPAAPREIFDLAETAFGPVEILVNNASGWVADTFAGETTDRLERRLRPVTAASISQVFAVDAVGAALLIGEFAERHRRHGLTWGRIIGLGSGGPAGFPEEVSYGAAKAAQENFTMSAAAELFERGITANVVHPPVTDTGWITDAVRRAIEASWPWNRVVTADAVAEVVVSLTSEAARLVTGNVIRLR